MAKDRGVQPGRAVFERVPNETLRHRVLEPLRNAILFGQLAPGYHLLEADLAAQLGVSRVPIREALRQLEQEGLVVSSPHRGSEVAAVDEAEVDLLYFLRAELEGFAVRSLMQRGVAELIAPLQDLVDGMRRAARQGNLLDLAERDVRFHRLLVVSSGYRTLERVWSSMDGPIRARLHRCLTGPFRQRLIEYTPESHQPIVDVMARGDVDGAVAAIKTHIIETVRLVLKGLQEPREDGDADNGGQTR